jgi:hypothetical protein
MRTLDNKSLFLIREEGPAYTYSADIQAPPIQNNWISAICFPDIELKITDPNVIVGEHSGRVEMTMTDIINQSPRLLEEIKKATEGLKHETLLDDENIFGK